MSRGPTAKPKTPVVFMAGVPEAPSRLTDEGRAEYKRVVDLCRDAGRELQQTDSAILEGYAQSFADYWREDAFLKTEGTVLKATNGISMANPRCRLRDNAWKQLLSAAGKLGFSPVDRVRVSYPAGSKRDEFDPLKGLIR